MPAELGCRVFRSELICNTEDLPLTPDHMRCLSLLSVRCFCPGSLETYVNGGVDDAGGRDDGAGEEDEFRLVKDTVCFWRVVGHSFDPIHGSTFGIKIILKFFEYSPLPGPMASQAHHELVAQQRRCAPRKVVPARSSWGEGRDVGRRDR